MELPVAIDLRADKHGDNNNQPDQNNSLEHTASIDDRSTWSTKEKDIQDALAHINLHRPVAEALVRGSNREQNIILASLLLATLQQAGYGAQMLYAIATAEEPEYGAMPPEEEQVFPLQVVEQPELA